MFFHDLIAALHEAAREFRRRRQLRRFCKQLRTPFD